MDGPVTDPTPQAPPDAGSQGVSSPPPASSPPPQTTGTESAVASPAPQGSGAGDFIPLREAAKGLGYDLGDAADDNAALQRLVQAANQAKQLEAHYNQYSPYVNEYMQYADQFKTWQRQQQEQAQAAQQKANSWWNAPEFDPNWRSQLQQDPTTGRIVPVGNASPEIVNKYLAAENHRRQFMDKFAFDPVGSIRPGIEQIAAQVAQQIVQQNLGGYQTTQFAQDFVKQNSSWIHQRNQDGSVMVNPQTGMPQLSPYGQRFAQYVSQAGQLGIQDEQQRAQYAYGLVQRDYALEKLKASPQDQQQAANQQFLAARNQPNQSGVLPSNPLSPNQAPNESRLGKGLAQRMREDFQKNGLKSEAFS